MTEAEHIRKAYDDLSRKYLNAQRSVIAEWSGDIRGETLMLFDEVNVLRKGVGLDPLPRSVVDPHGMYDEEDDADDI